MVVAGTLIHEVFPSGRGILPVVLLGMMLASGSVRAEVTVPQTGEYVVDSAGVLDPNTKAEMEGWLKELEQKTGAQVKVLTVQTTDNEDIFQFAQRHYDLWKLGKKGTSKGALIVLAVREHKIRIHTGYGLEGDLPDSWCGSLSRSVVQEYFKRGAYADGLKQMVVAVANRIADQAGVKLGTPDIRHEMAPDNSNAWALVIIVLVLALIYYSYWRRQQMGGGGSGYGRGFGAGMGPFFTTTYGDDPWGGSWGGGSSGGGSFGGGSWGGGGSSGGGGGGASW